MQRANNRADTFVDVLILHGSDIDFCKKLAQVLESAGFRAGRVIDFPRVKSDQGDNVDFYIENCGVPLVVLTYDDQESGSKKARPNVYDELLRCTKLRKGNFIVLRELRNGKPVDIASNQIEDLPIPIKFDRSASYELLRDLFNEIRKHYRPFSATTSKILSTFMDKMDEIWEEGFDKAWEIIHRKDADAERKFGIALDNFFERYQKVLRKSVTERPRANVMRKACNEALEAAVEYLSEVWELAAESKLESAGRPGAAKVVRNNLDSAEKELRRIAKAADDAEKITRAKRVIELLDDEADLGKLSSVKSLSI